MVSDTVLSDELRASSLEARPTKLRTALMVVQHVQVTGRLYRDFYVIGDIHGSLSGLRSILRHSGLLNKDENWSGRRAHVVQCGDIVDRGPESEACLDLLLKLRLQARKAGGRVDLLVGNHELALARGDHSISDVANPAALGEALQRAVRCGRVVAARAYRHYLITHAGVNPSLIRILIAEARQQSGRRVTVAAVARHLNQKLKHAFVSGDFSHPMFHVGQSRGGRHERGGVFWADFDFEHDANWRHPRIWQIFGHTPPTDSGEQFRVCPDSKRVNIDVGICETYGGYLAYVKLLPDRIVGVHCGDAAFEEEILVSTEIPVGAG